MPYSQPTIGTFHFKMGRWQLEICEEVMFMQISMSHLHPEYSNNSTWSFWRYIFMYFLKSEIHGNSIATTCYIDGLLDGNSKRSKRDVLFEVIFFLSCFRGLSRSSRCCYCYCIFSLFFVWGEGGRQEVLIDRVSKTSRIVGFGGCWYFHARTEW